MSRLIALALLLLPLSMNAVARNTFSICYFDEDRITTRIPNPPIFLKNSPSTKVERGFMIFFERRFFDFPAMSVYLGADIGKWFLGEDSIFTTSLFPAARVWIMHFPYFHPFAEYSMFGPTILSKDSFSVKLHFKSNFLFQSFFNIGAEIGEHRGVCLSLKMFQYNHRNFSEKDSFQVPIMFSAGVIF